MSPSVILTSGRTGFLAYSSKLLQWLLTSMETEKKMCPWTPSCSGEANSVGLVTLVQYTLLWSMIYEKNSLYFCRQNLGWTRTEKITCKGWEIHINMNVLISIWETIRDFSCTVEGTSLRRYPCQSFEFWWFSGRSLELQRMDGKEAKAFERSNVNYFSTCHIVFPTTTLTSYRRVNSFWLG